MHTRVKARLKSLKQFALSLPETQPKSPWPGHDDVAVNNKTFVYLGTREEQLSIGVKLPVSGRDVLLRDGARPMAYGLGKSGWVSITIAEDEGDEALDRVRRWIVESYKAQAPKRAWRQFESEQPWVDAGGLPTGRRASRIAAKPGPV